MVSKARKQKVASPKPLIKLDIACGQNKQDGFVGIDKSAVTGVDIVCDLLVFPWPVKDETVEEAKCSHFFEHIPGKLRGKFMDELFRVMIKEAKATFVMPYYATSRAVQDFTHEWPPVCEQSFLYFNKGWREQNKLDHYDVKCDFDFTYGYIMDNTWAVRHEEAKAFALKHYSNVAMDLQVTLIKRG